MKKAKRPVTWVVYRRTLHGKLVGVNAVCERSEWDALERAQPGYHTLVQAGFTNEGEAEQLARNTPVGGVPVGVSLVPVAPRGAPGPTFG
jgi:hypothetical protein